MTSLSAREAHHDSHSRRPRLFDFAWRIRARGMGEILASTGFRHNTELSSVRHFQSSVAFIVALRKGVFRCWNSCRLIASLRAKFPDQMVESQNKTPANRSHQSSPTSRKHSGRPTLRLTSRHFVAAVCALPSGISAANENGPATRSRPSFPKFSVVTPCGTSRCAPGKRRPF